MKNNISKCLAIVVPCLNEQEVLLKTNYELLTLLDALTENNLINLKSYILFVDDGSFDDTWTLIKQLCEKHKRVRG